MSAINSGALVGDPMSAVGRVSTTVGTAFLTVHGLVDVDNT